MAVTDIAVGCAALDYGCATYSSHQVDAVIAREEEPTRDINGRLSDQPSQQLKPEI
jgi:hypothetical protein